MATRVQHNLPTLLPPAMSRSSSSSTITLIPSTPPAHKDAFVDSPLTVATPSLPDHPAFAAKCRDLSAVKITKPIKAVFKDALAGLDRPLRIVGLLATSDSGCHMYADMTARACKQAEVVFDKVDLSAAEDDYDDSASFAAVRAKIVEINDDLTVDGLIVYFPLFDAERDAELRALIAPRVDVEGVHPQSLERSYDHAPSTVAELTANPAAATVYPCTALAVVRALQSDEVGIYNSYASVGHRFAGKTVTVINRSETVGRPLAGMLANDGARVYSVDIDSTHVYERDAAEDRHTVTVHPEVKPALASLLAESDIVVTAVPGASFKAPTLALRPGAICIDLSELGNFEADVRDRAGVFAPRLGSVTILMLKLNAFVLRMQHA
ncbi:hypothetical protein Q8F55_000376 [Vanrija albida]|uniref:Methylenetetrahydrofolate dehydrogenase n=1 Tax=Vanrija albida TaxID=181172 RepID=A0ABR3QD35_9TREE